MSSSMMSSILDALRTAVRRGAADLSDAQLLDLYVAQQDEAAFAAIVRRHGPMVLAVCRRVLPNLPDAEDAFQATFLVLVRKASAIRPREMLGSWLHGVAWRAAQKVRVAAARRQARERLVEDLPEPASVAEGLWKDLQPLLDQELHRLPEKYRLPIVLCDLEGKTRKEAAQQLGWPEGTVAGRLAAARDLLARKLTRHGLPLSGGMLTALLSQQVAPAVPEALASSTVSSAALWAAGKVVGAAPARVAVLCQAVLRGMLIRRASIVAAIVLMFGLSGLGAGLVVSAALAPPAQRDGDGPPVARAARKGKEEVPLWSQKSLTGHTGAVQCLAFGSPGRSRTILASAGADGTIRLWDVGDGKTKAILRGHTGPVRALASSRDGGVLASAGEDGTILLWDLGSGTRKRCLEAEKRAGTCLALSADGKRLASGAATGAIQLWDVATGRNTCCLSGDEDGTLGLVFSPDGETLASGSQDGTIEMWDVASGKEKDALDLGCPKASDSGACYLAFSPDSKSIVALRNTTITLWDVTTGKEKLRLQQKKEVCGLAISPDGKLLASGNDDNTVQLWDAATGKKRAVLDGHSGGVLCVAFSPDGKVLASAGSDNTVKLWSLRAFRKRPR
jgi:RNA polymerase sigma factor (sigma-70 family)